jgi:hypothetical protein
MFFTNWATKKPVRTREEWLQLPYSEREKRVKRCPHPEEHLERVGQLEIERDGYAEQNSDYYPVVEIHRCLICHKYFAAKRFCIESFRKAKPRAR